MTRRLGRGLAAVALVLLLVVMVFPAYWMVASSLSTKSQFERPPQFVPIPATLRAYATAVFDSPLGLWFSNTVLVALGTTAVSLAVSVLAGLGMSRFRSRFSGGFGAFVLVTQMVPATLLAVPMYIIFGRLGLLDQLPGLILANTAFAVPLATWMLKGFFDAVPRDLEEAAQVDGCTLISAYRRITIPLAAPGIAAVAVFCFLLAWGEFFFARTLIRSDSKWVLSLGLDSFQGQYTTDWSTMLASAVLFTLPPMVFFLIVQRHLTSGLTSGAVKG